MNKQNWQQGDVLLEQYEVLGTLGEGGMGTVYKVHHRGWNIDLAVKSPQPEVFVRADGKENFIREAETWVNLPLHPHIVSCYYVRLIDEIPRIFAEYVAGGSLGDWIGSRRLYKGGHQQALERMLDLAIQFAWGLHAAHEQGLVHQDIKPANVMMNPEGVAKVTDFGLAKARAMAGEQGSEEDNDRRSILVSSRGMTPAYCSPEQAAGKALSRKTDIWSWAVSLLEMWTGEVTWRSGMLAREALSNYDPQDAAIPPLPAKLVTLLARCFESQPKERPATMLEVAITLQAIYAHEIGQTYPREASQAATLQADTLNNRALSLFDLGKVEQAMRVWEQALRADPQHLEANYNRGVVLWRQGKLSDDALIDRLKMVRSAQIQSGWGSYLLAQINLEQGDVITALELLEEASQLAPHEEEIEKLLEQAKTLPSSNEGFYLYDMYGWILSESLSANGHWLVCGYENGVIKLGDVVAECCLRTFEGHTAEITAVSISEDGRWIVSGSQDHTMRIWEAATGQCMYTVECWNYDWVTAVKLSKDGHWIVSGSQEGDVALRETATGRCICSFGSDKDNYNAALDLGFVGSFQGHISTVTAISISEDRHWIVSGSQDCIVKFWDTLVKRCQRTFEGHTAEVTAVSISEDGRWIASGSKDHTMRIWEATTGHCAHILQGHTAEITAVSISEDGRWIVSGSEDHTVQYWDAVTGCRVQVFRNLFNSAEAVSLSEDGCWIAASFGDGTAQRWERRPFQSPPCSLAPSRFLSFTDVMQTHASARTLLQQVSHALKTQQFAQALDTLNQVRSLPGWERHSQCMNAWARLSRHCFRAHLRAAWHAKTVVVVPQEILGACPVSVDVNGNWSASSGSDGVIWLWEVKAGRYLQRFKGHHERATAIGISSDGRFLVSGSSDATIRLWETATGRCLRIFQGHTGSVTSVSISGDGRWIASGSWDRTIRLWETSTGRCLRILEGHRNGYTAVTSVSLSRDGCWIASSSGEDPVARVWETATGRCVHQLIDHSRSTVMTVDLNANGSLLVCGCSNGTIQLWEVANERCLHVLTGHVKGVNGLRLSSDERWIVSGGDDCTVRLWEATTGRCVYTLEGHGYGVTSVSLSSDGRWIVSGTCGSTARLWELDWELETHDPTAWDEGARTCLEIFLTLHTPYAAEMPQDREPTEREIQQALTRRGTPIWKEEDFQELIHQLQDTGYGWLRPEGIHRQLEHMVRERQEPSSLSEEEKGNGA
ncbi:protein kinase domain-containing protein [Ktedonobacter racemifer]|uniref:Serine/threonine protein kinase with WD40 repeats n=1 Tax=Ktedonobacter racemifer DSM 44963 TaxID=485913 RepID=D6TCN1_KTERA|nr:protein kinase [Ktedonobacter racemifer]EFH88145.1 serine/threonine protein kinase with WD40 repeats [Ktedonobacter racemifer DSM 44963]